MTAFKAETDRFLEAWMQVRQLVQASNFNRFQRAGLSATQFMTLNVIPKDGTTLSEIARRLNLSAATLNATVNSLAERGLVLRAKNRSDGRKVTIRATKQGEAMQNAASNEFHSFVAGLFARMSKTRRDGLLAGLEELVRLSTVDHVNASDTGPQSIETIRRDGGALPAKRSFRRSPRQ